jgi:hypothetical protein
MQVPATQTLALLPQSASMQHSVTEMHAPLQSLSPDEHEVTGPVSPAPPSCDPVEEALPVAVDEELLLLLCLVVPSLWDVVPASPASTSLVADDVQPPTTTLSATPQTNALTSPILLLQLSIDPPRPGHRASRALLGESSPSFVTRWTDQLNPGNEQGAREIGRYSSGFPPDLPRSLFHFQGQVVHDQGNGHESRGNVA